MFCHSCCRARQVIASDMRFYSHLCVIRPFQLETVRLHTSHFILLSSSVPTRHTHTHTVHMIPNTDWWKAPFSKLMCLGRCSGPLLLRNSCLLCARKSQWLFLLFFHCCRKYKTNNLQTKKMSKWKGIFSQMLVGWFVIWNISLCYAEKRRPHPKGRRQQTEKKNANG